MSIKNTVKNPLALVIGATLASGVLATAQAENPFSSTELSSGYMQLADASTATAGKTEEGKCGEGKCGGEKTEKAEDGKTEEGKCGEGKCGVENADADKDGKVTKEEFIKLHEDVFAKMDKDSNGVLEGDELKMHKDKEGKCGEGKCGAEKDDKAAEPKAEEGDKKE
jgi:uncharacterized low-complexity protein